jgi:hypothetical protein
MLNLKTSSIVVPKLTPVNHHPPQLLFLPHRLLSELPQKLSAGEMKNQVYRLFYENV